MTSYFYGGRSLLIMADNGQIADLSIQARAEPKTVNEQVFPSTFWFSSQTEEEISPWWSEQRDIDLRNFVKKDGNDILIGAVSSLLKKFKSMNWLLEGRSSRTKRVPKKGTVEFYQPVLANADLGKGWSVLLSKTLEDYLCLYGPSGIKLGGDRRGKTKSIGEIVRDKDPGPVLSVNQNGEIVEKNIIEWKKTPLGDRRWWWISLKSSMHGHSGNRGGLYLTEDHPVFTENGWLYARDVKAGMKVAISDPCPTEEQKEVIVGTMMGDAGMQFKGKRSLMGFVHAKKQEDWLLHKVNSLEGFDWTPMNGTDTLNINSHVTTSFNSIREAFYPNGKKVVPRNLFEKYFSPRLLSTWYCDDGGIGHPRSKNGNPTRNTADIATHSFVKEDTEWLCEFLCDEGMPCKVQKTTMRNKEYHYLRFNVDGAEKLFDFIAPYVPHSMRYKLPKNARGYDAVNWKLPKATISFSEVEISREKDPREKYGGCDTTYHIGVKDTENFIAANMVVHNTQDKGAFWELIGEGEPDSMLEGAVLGIAHLDAAQCAPTGDIVYPVLYRNPKKGTTHKLHTSRVVRLTDMPSSVEGMMDIGFCAVSRVIASSMVLLKLARYKNEKLSDLPEAGLLILNNIMRHQWEDAEASFQRERRKLGQDFWVNIMTFFGVDPAQQASATFTNFSSLPDAFNELESTNIYVNVVALCFGVDVREFWPLTGGQLGTASESEVQHKKARGKGIGELIGLIERAINWRVLPKTVSFKFDFRDDEEDALRASIAKVRTDTIMSMWQPPRGEGDPPPVSSEEIRQMLAEAVPYFKDEFLSEDLTENVELTDIDRQDI